MYWVWLFIVLVAGVFPYRETSTVFDSAWFWSTLGHIGSLVVFGALAKFYTPFSQLNLVRIGAPLLSILGFCALLYSGTLSNDAFGPFIFGGITTGIGTGGLLICWCELYSALYRSPRQRIAISSGILISIIIFVALAFLPTAIFIAIMLILPLVPMICTLIGLKLIDYAIPRVAEDEPALSPRFAFFCLVNAIPLGFFQMRHILNAQNSTSSWVLMLLLAFCAIGIIVVADSILLVKRNTSILPKVVIPIAVAGLLPLAAFGGSNTLAAGTLVYAAQQLLTIMLYSLFAEIAYSGKMQPGKIFAFGVCLTDGGFIAGLIVGELATTWFGGYHLEVTLVVIYLVAFAGYLIASRLPDGADLAQDKKKIDTSASDSGLSHSLEYKIDETARRYALTTREQEMLRYVLRGRSVPAIASETFLSRNTVKTHLNHVYQKLNVHSRDELIDFVEHLPEK